MEQTELLVNPGTAPFSRIKYLQRFGKDAQVQEFVNGLFLAAVESKYQGDWDLVSDFLERWDDSAIALQFQGRRITDAGPAPWTRLRKPLSKCTVALVTTGGPFRQRPEALRAGRPNPQRDTS